jgi:hypothetical protein
MSDSNPERDVFTPDGRKIHGARRVSLDGTLGPREWPRPEPRRTYAQAAGRARLQ